MEKAMEKKLFSKLGVSASVLGFGCMRLPTKEGKIDEALATQMIDHAYQSGITYFDTAWPYHSTESEPFVGQALKKYPRESFQLTTKMPVWLCENSQDLEKYFRLQLERCQVDYFDFYLLHALSKERFEHCKKIGAFEFIKKLRQEGKIKAAGFSFHDDNSRFQEIVEHFDWDFAQIQHNYIDNTLMRSKELYQLLEQKDIPCVVMEPVRGGFLSQLPQEAASLFTAHSPERSLSSWAIRWVAGHPNIKVVLSGMSTMEQLEDNLATLSDPNYPLNQQEHRVVDQVVEQLMSYKTVPCTGCRYCMDCPHGVNIPGVFTNFNKFSMFRNKERAKTEYFDNMPAEAHGDRCMECLACVPACPQQINIPQELKAAHAALKAALV